MDIKKGIKYIAIGFLFTLVNLNLTFSDVAINFTPDFVGWILFYLAFDKLGTYAEDKQYLKWTSLVLAIFYAVIWIFGIVKPDVNIDLLEDIVSIVSVVYTFILFGILEKIAHDHAPLKEKTLRVLKYINVIFYAAFLICGLITVYSKSEMMAVPTMVFGVACLVAAVITCLTLFKLSKEISTKEI